jgi:signal transduction histidine kinase
MKSTRRRAHSTRPLQIGFLLLLGVCVAQVAWWIIDQVEYTAEVATRLQTLHGSDVEAARALLRLGTDPRDIARLYPSLEIGSDASSIRVAPSVVQMLSIERTRRLNRYAWEGAFFLVVLVGAMGVVYRALRERAVLRRRQEDFLEAVSHELKSPLASLRLTGETLALRNPSGDQRNRLVQRLLEDVERLDRMIGNILETSRLSSGTPQAAPGMLILAEEVDAVIEELREQAEGYAVTLSRDVPGELTLRADRDAVRTVIRNLLHNAIRAARGGGAVTVTSAPMNGRIRLEVRDNGIGFPPNEASQLFEKFYRVPDEGRERLPGTGLGLYLVRRCAELNGGSVAAVSAGPNKGAVFMVDWPAAGDVRL